MTILCVVGARPNFTKIAPIMAALKQANIPAKLVHTGQHYDEAMKASFFRELGIPEPDVDLEVGSASHAVQTAEIMKRFEPVVDDIQPKAVLVVGDVNSTIACALVAAKKGVKVIHVEAGLRSYDRQMPEEINRVLTDQISDYLFLTEEDAAANLAREGISKGVHFVGNVMIDSVFNNLDRAIPLNQTLNAEQQAQIMNGFALLTLHRPSNVDDPHTLLALLQVIQRIARHMRVVFPVHPRTRARINANAECAAILQDANILVLEPVSYHAILGLMRAAKLVLTDSGGIQEETTALGVPCFTLRENTERPITISEGTNTLVGTDPQAIWSAFEALQNGAGKQGRAPKFWDGKAAERIVAILKTELDY